ncbi:unnamed protein product [Acanthoscelides obtectus]|uniref:Uncharacterized protein n=1 Tax=Acanthoscelides obtectus TaxID=200917 RepID=A0A9P0K3V1_ACAOB|nr:unnamed protein product [Acanthoscelides obtectus]CAK1658662.1 hypothetical protein AOBTE_LOCUS21055 [Acanthoscelides obtectus]
MSLWSTRFTITSRETKVRTELVPFRRGSLPRGIFKSPALLHLTSPAACCAEKCERIQLWHAQQPAAQGPKSIVHLRGHPNP